MRTHWLHMLYDYWYEKYTPYLDYSDLWPDQLYKYFNGIMLGESIESDYLKWNSEKHILIPKYDITRSLVPPVKHQYVTMQQDDTQDDTLLKITSQSCNGFLTYKVRSEELIYITFIYYVLSTLVIYPEYLDPENFYFHWYSRKKRNACIIIF